MCGLNWSKPRITVHGMSINGWNCAAGVGTRWKVDFLLYYVRVDGAAYLGNGWWITELGFQDWVRWGVDSIRNQNERKGIR